MVVRCAQLSNVDKRTVEITVRNYNEPAWCILSAIRDLVPDSSKRSARITRPLINVDCSLVLFKCNFIDNYSFSAIHCEETEVVAC